MRNVETALLHGHPLISEENDQILRLRDTYPEWGIGRAEAGGFTAFHREESFNERASRIGVVVELHRDTVEQLAEALAVQRALRGDGADPLPGEPR